MLDDEKKGATLVRTLIKLSCALTVGGAGGILHFGIAMLGADAIAAAAVPDTDNAGEQPGWMWRDMRVVSTSAINDSTQHVRLDQEIKSKRRWPGQDMDLVLIIDAGVLTDPVNVDGLIRTLVAKS